MTNSGSILSILISLIIAALMMTAGSQGSVIINELPLFLVCASIGFILHWMIFIPSCIHLILSYENDNGHETLEIVVRERHEPRNHINPYTKTTWAPKCY